MFPDIIKKMPSYIDKDTGTETYFDHTPIGTIYFFSTEKGYPMSADHVHAKQWGVVLEGECTIHINGETWHYKKGETYLVPAGIPHRTIYDAGFAEIGYVDDPKYSG